MNPFLYKWLKLSLVSLVGVGFLALAVYAFIMRDEIRAAQIEPPLIEGPTNPLKTRPENAGGLQFPNQDKLVFDLLEDTAAPAAVGVAVVAESLGQEASPTEPATLSATYMPGGTAVNEPAIEPATPAATPVVAMPRVTPTVATPVAAMAKIEPKPEPKAEVKAEPKPEPKTEPKPEVKLGGSWSVQLAAVGSQPDAMTAAKKLQAKYSALKALKIRVVAAPDGKRFRVQFTGLANRDAAQRVCDGLGSQPCFPVGK